MIQKIFIVIVLLTFSATLFCQNEAALNSTDQQGMKQGRWIKKDARGIVVYDGIFKDDHPVGEFKRFYDDNTLQSLLIYSEDGSEALANIYHSNGYIGSSGRYLNQMKEGKWQFFSNFLKGYLVMEEIYSRNIRNGPSIKFYTDSTVLERITYINGIKQGEWMQYYPSGKIRLKSNYLNGKVNGKFVVWFENGQIQFSGQYKNDERDGLWLINNEDGTLKYKLQYKNGFTEDRQMTIDDSDYLDSLEQNKGKIADPEKTGIIR